MISDDFMTAFNQPIASCLCDTEMTPKWPVRAAAYDSAATVYLQLLSLAVIKRLALLIAIKCASSVLVSHCSSDSPFTSDLESRLLL